MTRIVSKMTLIIVMALLLMTTRANAQSSSAGTLYRNGQPYSPPRTSLLPDRTGASSSAAESSVESASGDIVDVSGSGEIVATGSTVITVPVSSSSEASSDPLGTPGDPFMPPPDVFGTTTVEEPIPGDVFEVDTTVPAATDEAGSMMGILGSVLTIVVIIAGGIGYFLWRRHRIKSLAAELASAPPPPLAGIETSGKLQDAIDDMKSTDFS